MPKVVLNKYEQVMYRRGDDGKPTNEELQGKDLYLAQCDSMLRRFKKSVDRSGILEDYRKHEAFLPKSLRRKEKQKRAKIRRIKMNKKHAHSKQYFSKFNNFHKHENNFNKDDNHEGGNE